MLEQVNTGPFQKCPVRNTFILNNHKSTLDHLLLVYYNVLCLSLTNNQHISITQNSPSFSHSRQKSLCVPSGTYEMALYICCKLQRHLQVFHSNLTIFFMNLGHFLVNFYDILRHNLRYLLIIWNIILTNIVKSGHISTFRARFHCKDTFS